MKDAKNLQAEAKELVKKAKAEYDLVNIMTIEEWRNQKIPFTFEENQEEEITQ